MKTIEKELEQIASQYAKIKLELDMAKKEKDSLHGRVNTMESDLARMKPWDYHFCFGPNFDAFYSWVSLKGTPLIKKILEKSKMQ